MYIYVCCSFFEKNKRRAAPAVSRRTPLIRVYAKPFHVLRFTVSKPRKVSTKKKCMRKNHDFRFTAPKHILALNHNDLIKFIVLISIVGHSFVGRSFIAMRTAIFSQLSAVFN